MEFNWDQCGQVGKAIGFDRAEPGGSKHLAIWKAWKKDGPVLGEHWLKRTLLVDFGFRFPVSFNHKHVQSQNLQRPHLCSALRRGKVSLIQHAAPESSVRGPWLGLAGHGWACWAGDFTRFSCSIPILKWVAIDFVLLLSIESIRCIFSNWTRVLRDDVGWSIDNRHHPVLHSWPDHARGFIRPRVLRHLAKDRGATHGRDYPIFSKCLSEFSWHWFDPLEANSGKLPKVKKHTWTSVRFTPLAILATGLKAVCSSDWQRLKCFTRLQSSS